MSAGGGLYYLSFAPVRTTIGRVEHRLSCVRAQKWPGDVAGWCRQSLRLVTL